MISSKFTSLIRENIDRLAGQWVRRVRNAPHMKAYNKLSDEELKRRNKLFYENLVRWQEEGASLAEVGKYFARVGRERYHEGFPLEEVDYTVILAKRVLMDFILSEGLFANALAIYQALETLTMIYNFFDLGFFYIGKEYLEEMHTTLEATKKLSDDDLKAYLFPGSRISDKELETLFGIKMGM